jgi:hypothetical protein
MNPRSTAFETRTLSITPSMNPRSTTFETGTLTKKREHSALSQMRSLILIFNRICGVMVNVLVSKAVDRGFISGVMVSLSVSKAVDRGFIGAGWCACLKSGRS